MMLTKQMEKSHFLQIQMLPTPLVHFLHHARDVTKHAHDVTKQPNQQQQKQHSVPNAPNAARLDLQRSWQQGLRMLRATQLCKETGLLRRHEGV